MKTKYIVYDYAGYIFPAHVIHLDFARRMRMKFNEINGAGFITINQGKLICSGKSISLKINGNKEKDSEIMNRMINLY